jgi:hypothetical protein
MSSCKVTHQGQEDKRSKENIRKSCVDFFDVCSAATIGKDNANIITWMRYHVILICHKTVRYISREPKMLRVLTLVTESKDTLLAFLCL